MLDDTFIDELKKLARSEPLDPWNTKSYALLVILEELGFVKKNEKDQFMLTSQGRCQIILAGKK
jgi:hypothetical protein